MMDMSVLMACQFLLKQVSNEGNNALLSQLYQYLLFDFRIWSHSHFAVCLGKQPKHITIALAIAFLYIKCK